MRALLFGRFENSAFVVMSPDGSEWLTDPGRGPNQSLGGGPTQYAPKTAAMRAIADRYKPTGNPAAAVLQDFDSFAQALNVASADQRPLVVIDATADPQGLAKAQQTLAPLVASARFTGRFHVDSSPEKGWAAALADAKAPPGIHVLFPGEFGLDATLHTTLPLRASPSEIAGALAAAKTTYAGSEKRKAYREHVAKGRRDGVFIESNIPYGEDRDGDGEIDPAPGPRRRR